MALQTATTFSLVAFAWIFFRADSVSNAGYIATHLFTGLGGFLAGDALTFWVPRVGSSANEMYVALLGIAIMELVQQLHNRRSMTLRMAEWSMVKRYAVYTGIIAFCVFLGSYYHTAQFIYFQF